ncbi:MAG TPA: hypothetical protein VLH09_14750 [Bryobacteraceae bacterium]|nr:hypothetical protein [Bryobacteraceae bacterium]
MTNGNGTSKKVQFQTNIPVEVALAYDGGKQVEGNFGPQFMFSLAEAPNGETTMYVPPIVADKLAELQVGKGQRVAICKAEVKQGNRRSIQWQVTRVDPDPRWQEEARPQSAPPPGKVNGAGQDQRPGGEPGQVQPTTPVIAGESGPIADRTAPASGNGKPPVSGNGHATHNGIPYWDPKTELRRCYEDAIEVLVAARDTAAQKGLPVQFTGDDLRQVAATLYIDAGKDRRTPWAGGAR